MANNSFFDESLEQSQIKAKIVKNYFWVWAKIIIATLKRGTNNPRIAYIDLFAGPGRYKDETKSTPILILEDALKHPDMRDMLVTMFNDANSDNTNSLEKSISDIPDIHQLKHKPIIRNNEVGDNMVKMFEQITLVPTLFFVDPWGYKGLSLRLINSVLKDWGCDCIFFFNYNRISMGLSNDKVAEHMNALFGEDRADKIRLKISNTTPDERELIIVNEIAQALKDLGGKFVLPFRFKNQAGNRTSHHLIFVSKHFRGYEVMKEVMWKQSSEEYDGIGTFEYNPANERQPLLYLFRPRPIEDLKDELCKKYSGKSFSMKELYEQHSIDTPYIAKNYKNALMQLEIDGRIIANPPQDKRKKDTFGDNVVVTFP